jgi:YHS domain-containing protein
MKLKIVCDWCGREFFRDSAQLKGKKHHFCSRQCLADFSSKAKNPDGYASLKDFTNISQHMTKLNEELNPDRMTPETKEKLRDPASEKADATVIPKSMDLPHIAS